jgi:hypothetical protein
MSEPVFAGHAAAGRHRGGVAWQADGRTRTHSCDDPDRAAEAIAETLTRTVP